MGGQQNQLPQANMMSQQSMPQANMMSQQSMPQMNQMPQAFMTPSFGASGPSAGPQQLICSVHGKKRSVRNLMEDGQGGYCCSPGNECGAPGSGPLMPGDWMCPS